LAVGLGALLIAACTAAGTPVPSTTKTLTFAFQGAFGVPQVTILAALDELRGQGYSIETPQLNDPSLNAQGTSEGRFQYTLVDNVVLKAIQEGAKVKIVGESFGNVWQIVTASDIKECKDLKGRSVGVFSVGSFNDVSVKAYIDENCPGTTVNMLALGDSTARAAAMIAGKLDASPLELGDAIPLLKEGGTKFHVLANFSKDLPKLRISFIASNTDFNSKNQATTQALLKALINQNRKASKDAAYLKSLITKYVPSADQSTLDEVVKAFQDGGLFDVNGGLNDDNMNYTIQFFTKAGTIKSGLGLNDVSDLSALNAVLKDVGRQ
jgi:NitT/TauT family transport system substrate-binding protein